ncbi:MAG: hypothetical protein A2X14_01435 [Bacteroidetes bacterium GWD2_33_33]|nr:MAG: hypothetical protein A2X14_01435 [Bacteroidetes bacterium GWD2_33_33]
MKKITFIIILLPFVSQINANSLVDTTFVDKQFVSVDFFNYKLSNAVLINCNMFESNFDSTNWDNINLRGCTFQNSEYIRDASFSDVHFINGLIKDFSLYNNQINRVYIEDAYIDEFELNDCNINTLVIKNCVSNNIKIRNSRLKNLKIIGGSIEHIEFVNDSIFELEIGHVKYTSILFKAGYALKVKLINTLSNSKSSLKFIETIIEYPRLCNIDISKVDFTRAIFDFNSFQLLDDYECDKGLYGNVIAKSKYLEARDTYYLIHKQFQEAGILHTQRKFEFLMHEAFVKTKNKSFSTCIYVLWNKYIRGYYGLSPMIVLYSASIVWLLFSFIYILLGQFTNVAWALYLPLNIHGVAVSNVHPRFLNQPLWKLSFSYMNHCMLFSLQQLLLPSFSRSGLSLFKGIGFSQKLLIPIGFGKMLSFIQYIIGLILLFNFVQAFIRVL